MLYYVEALWFSSLGYGDVFWKTLNLQAAIFAAFAATTFALIYGSFLALKPARSDEPGWGGVILVNGRPVQLPVEPVIRAAALLLAIAAAFISGTSFVSNWPTLALWWYGKPAAAQAGIAATDPIFGRPIAFYLFALPAWELVVTWLTTLAVLTCVIALFFFVISGGTLVLRGRRGRHDASARGLSIAWAFLLLVFAARAYLGRFERMFEDRTDLRRRHVHRRARHPDRTARRVARPRRGSARRGGVTRSRAPRVRWLVARRGARRSVLSRDRGHRCLCQDVHRQAERTRARAAVHRAQHRADSPGVRTAIGSRSARFRPRRASRLPTLRTIRRRCRTSACGTGGRSRTRSARSRRSAPTTISRTSTSIATRSTARCGR